MRHLYFAYGSNLDQNQMRERCPTSKPLGVAYLHGYRLAFTFYSTGRWKGGCADIIRDNNSTVWGYVYELTDRDLMRLDNYEGCPHCYKRFQTKAVSADGRELPHVWVYEVVNKESHLPSEEYINILLRAAIEYGFPDSYREYLESIREKVTSSRNEKR